MTIDEIIENFSTFDTWEDRYSYLIDLGKSLPALPAEFKTKEYKVDGCTSQVWFVPDQEQLKKEKIVFQAESDAFIVSGLIAIILVAFNGKSFEEAKSINIENIFKKLGFENHLSPTRRNGFFSMVNRIRSWQE